MTKVANVIDVLVGAGANEIGGINFTVTQASKHLDEAREKAIADARRKAEIYAKAAGVTLGEPHQHFRGRRAHAGISRQDGGADGRRRAGRAGRGDAVGDGERVLGDQGRRSNSAASRLVLGAEPRVSTDGDGPSRIRDGATRLLSMTGSLDLDHLPRLQRREPLRRNLRFLERLIQRHHRRVDRLIGQLERAVMMRQRLLARRNRPAPSPHRTDSCAGPS